MKNNTIAPLEQFELDASNNSYLDKLDKHKKRFVDFYTRLNGHITNACAAIPISRQTYYTWLDTDENFANAVAEAELHLITIQSCFISTPEMSSSLRVVIG